MSVKVARPSAAITPCLTHDMNTPRSQENKTRAIKIQVLELRLNVSKKQTLNQKSTLSDETSSIIWSFLDPSVSEISSFSFFFAGNRSDHILEMDLRSQVCLIYRMLLTSQLHQWHHLLPKQQFPQHLLRSMTCVTVPTAQNIVSKGRRGKHL